MIVDPVPHIPEGVSQLRCRCGRLLMKTGAGLVCQYAPAWEHINVTQAELLEVPWCSNHEQPMWPYRLFNKTSEAFACPINVTELRIKKENNK